MFNLRKKQRGFTLVEMMVVMAIISVLAAVVFPAVSGVGTTSHNARQVEDVKTVQGGVDRFNADSGYWSTGTAGGGATTGVLPGSALVTAGVLTGMIKGVTFDKTYTAPDPDKTFVPDYVRSNPLYYNVTATVATDGTTSADKLLTGKTYKNSSGTDWTIGGADITLTSVWLVDSTGKVYVVKDPAAY